jgi:Host cell surface-exposed lipoprotein
VFNGNYADLPAAKTTSDLMLNFLGGPGTGVTSAMVTIMAEHGTAPALRSAEAQLNTDVSAADNTSYASSAQNSAALVPLKAIRGICGTSAAWTQVTLTPAGLVAPSKSAPTTPAPVASAPSTPASQSMTSSQQQAVDAAQSYLNDGDGFSAYSLLNQLTSSYGNSFSQSDAQSELVKLGETSGGLSYLCGLLGLDGRSWLVDPHLDG